LKITVIGLGKIGLPLATYLAQKNQVIGLDINDQTVNYVNSGREPFPGEKNLKELLQKVIITKNLVATTDSQKAIKSSDFILICVPLVVNTENKPDFKGIDSVVNDIGKYLQKGALVSFETTLPVGTTRNRFTKIIEKISKLKVGKDFYVVFSPERVLTGRIFEDLTKYPKLVGGVTEQCTIKGVTFYESVLDFEGVNKNKKGQNVWALENCETAEFAKIAETTYRDVNIGLSNEFALYAAKKGINYTEVIKSANSQPYSNLHTPGISVGGHCIPVYPHFYISDNSESQIVQAARSRNLSMPRIAIEKIKKIFPNIENLSIGIFGLSYRPNVKEYAYSGAQALRDLLLESSVKVFGFDPFYSENEIINLGFNFTTNYNDLDGIIIHTEHADYKFFDFQRLNNLKFIFDGRNQLTHLNDGKHKFSYISFTN
jgi:UDP-N-acetyl-D-glucosamine dehydrogenase